MIKTIVVISIANPQYKCNSNTRYKSSVEVIWKIADSDEP